VKSLLIPAFLSLLSASAFGAEPAAAPAKTCVVPVFPAVSTNLSESLSIKRDVDKWSDCILAHPTEENLRQVADVKKKESDWKAASAKHYNRQAALDKTSFGAIMSARDSRDRLELENRAGGGQQAYLRDRVSNDVPEK
jgi:uncharacterized iron-regulated protein